METISEISTIFKDKGEVYFRKIETKYLEIYSWEKMLAESEDKSLDEAKKMQELGYLDCYVMITCFHQDFYEQYQDFAANNKDRIIKYFDLIIK